MHAIPRRAALLACVALAPLAQAQEPAGASFRRALEAEIERAASEGALAQVPDERVALAAWQARARAELRAVLGPLPAAAPPRVEVVRRHEYESYAVEALLIETRADMHVTALLFLPDPSRHSGARPGVVLACGHSAEGKAEPIYLAGAANLAHYGVAALIYDPLDQGERAQELDEDGYPARWGTKAHNISGLKAELVGWSQAGLELWDSMQMVGALAARPEVDAERIGALGNSGGGTQSAQLAALDPRVRAAAPSCYLTSLPLYLAQSTPPDMEQVPFGFLGLGLDHDVYATARAPRPLLVCAREADFFPVEGTRSVVERARAVYATLGHSDALALALEPGEHGWNAGLIEASVAWMCRWLGAEEGATPFVELMLPNAVESRVSPEGQVLLLEGERSIHSVLAAEAGRLRGVRRQRALAQRLTRARARVALPALADIEVPRIEERASTTEGALVIERSWLVWQDGTRLPAARVRPAEGTSEETIDLVLDEEGVEAVLTRYETHGLPTGRRAFVLDPACLGDARPWERQRYYSVFGPEANDAVLCHLLGRPLVGRQAAQILGAARALEGEGALELSARGRAVLPALHAAGLEPGLFDVVRISGELPSYTALFDRNNLQLEFGSLVHGALRDYELADLAVAAGVIESTEDEHGHVQH